MTANFVAKSQFPQSFGAMLICIITVHNELVVNIANKVPATGNEAFFVNAQSVHTR
jgi:hypothetical protein